MRGDPIIRVECNGGCGTEEEFGMTPLARGSFDDRNLEADLRAARWTVVGEDEEYCEDCAAAGNDGPAEAGKEAR